MSAHDQFTMRMGGGLTWLNTRHELDCTEILVLDTLILLDGPKGCHPTLEKIAKVCGRPQPTVRQVIKKLVKERRLIDYEKRPYRDSRGRERMSKNYYYIFSEEIEHALEFAAETLALDPEERQLSLLQDDPDSARDDQYRDQSEHLQDTPADPDSARGTRYRDPDSARDDQYRDQSEHLQDTPADPDSARDDQYRDQSEHLQDTPADPDSARGTRYRDPDSARDDQYRDPIARVTRANRGRLVGRKDLYLKKIKDPTYLPTYATPTEDHKTLTRAMLAHPDISLPKDFTEAVAHKLKPHVVFHVCLAYCADLRLGKVDDAGVLMYRLAHLDESLPRRLPNSQTENIQFYQDFYLYIQEVERENERKRYEQEIEENSP